MPIRPLTVLRRPLEYVYRSFLYRHPVRIADARLFCRLSVSRCERPSDDETAAVAMIRQKTAEHNLNNIMRTAAYFTFFERHPEVTSGIWP
ncbi:DUF2515 family protein [Geobacillus stearothermophilus]|uniref:DUF2515 family protein n=1 Tax=Geobacillus stearothermophilus TaxID=1422 RepID=UPI002E1C2E98|nr:DUF2515 family protein [Geobacillus stearothermophilus]